MCNLSANLRVPNVEHGLEDIGRGVCSWIILSVEQAQLVDGQVHQRLDVQHAVLDDTVIFCNRKSSIFLDDAFVFFY